MEVGNPREPAAREPPAVRGGSDAPTPVDRDGASSRGSSPKSRRALSPWEALNGQLDRLIGRECLEERWEGHQEPERNQRARRVDDRLPRWLRSAQRRCQQSPSTEEDGGRNDRLAREQPHRGQAERARTLNRNRLWSAGEGRWLDVHHASFQRTGAALVISAPNRPAIAAVAKAPTKSTSTIMRNRLSVTRLRP